MLLGKRPRKAPRQPADLAPLGVFDASDLEFSKRLHLLKVEPCSLQNTGIVTMVQVGGLQNIVGNSTTDKININQEGIPSEKRCFGRPIHQIQAVFVSFWTLVRSTKLSNRNHCGKNVLSQVPIWANRLLCRCIYTSITGYGLFGSSKLFLISLFASLSGQAR